MRLVVRLHGHGNGDEEFWSKVEDETDDVDDLLVSVVWVVIVVRGRCSATFVMFGRGAMSRKRRTRRTMKGRWSVMGMCRWSTGA